MFSKNFFLLLSFLSLSGCSLPLYEKPPEQVPIVIDLGDSTACLSGVLPVVEKFFSGDTKAAQITAAWDCLGTSILTFEKSVQGRFEDRFTDRELAHFIEQYFLEDGVRISDSLLIEIFRIKQLFVGGEVHSLTRQEMKNLTAVIQELKQITLNINPYMKVFAFNWEPESRVARERNIFFFEEANLALQQSAKDLASVISRNGMPYELSNIISLLGEMEAFSSEEWEWIPTVETTMPLVKKLKRTLAGGDENIISPLEWNRFALLGARGFVQYLRYFYFIKSAEISDGGASLVYFTKSIDDLFSFLGDMVGGKPGQELKVSEVLEILQALSDFVPNLKISEEFLNEAMKVKVVFFGGGTAVFKQEDFERARLKLESFQNLTELFLEHAKVYSLSWRSEEMPIEDARLYFKNADSNLTQVAKALGQNMESSYDLRDLIQLAEEIDKLYDIRFSGNKKLAELARQYIPVVISVKNIIFSDQGSVIGASLKPAFPHSSEQQWSRFLETFSQFYARFMYYHYFLKDSALSTGEGLTSFQTVVWDSTENLRNLMAQKEEKQISLEEINDLLNSVETAGLLPKSLSVQSITQVAKILIHRVLVPPELRLAGQVPTGFGPVAIDEFRNEFALWAGNQEFFDSIYQDDPDGKGKSGPEIVEALNGAQRSTGLFELKMIFTNPLALSFDSLGRMYLARPALNYQKETSTLINLVRTGVRSMIRSYAMSLQRIKDYQGITNAEANQFFQDLRPVIVELGLIGPDNESFANSRFRDANLFTAVGNGDDLADFKEGSNLFIMILSGLKVDDLIFAELEKQCEIEKPSEAKTSWRVSVQCARELYRQEIPHAFSSMPDFTRFHTSLPAERFDSLFLNLLKATEAKLDSEGFVRVEDLGLYAHVVQYIEGLFQMYDNDGDGLLKTVEAMQAYPRYRTLLASVSGLKKEKEIRGLYAWLLKKGKPPAGIEQIYFKGVWCKMKEEEWDLSANREVLASILGYIADAMSEN